MREARAATPHLDPTKSTIHSIRMFAKMGKEEKKKKETKRREKKTGERNRKAIKGLSSTKQPSLRASQDIMLCDPGGNRDLNGFERARLQ